MKKLSRPLLILIFIWALIAIVPPLRHVARVQFAGSDIIAFSVWPRESPRTYFIPKARWQSLSKKYPRNVILAIQSVETRFNVEEPDDENIAGVGSPRISYASSLNTEYQGLQLALRKSYDGILGRSNDRYWTPLLLAQRLKYTEGWMAPRRIAGELSNNFGNSDGARRNGRENFSVRDVEAAIALARRGQQLEPDNAFFDWALCKLLLIVWRDDEAMRVLACAMKKTRYDNHDLELKRVAVRAHEIALERPLLYEEKTRVLSKTSRSHYDYYSAPTETFENEALKILALKSVRARQRGDRTTSLQCAEYTLRIAALLRRNANPETRYKWASTEINVQNELWNDLLPKVGLATRRRRQAQTTGLQAFQKYARTHGRVDVAKLAAKTAKEANTVVAGTGSFEYQGRYLYGMPPFRLAALTVSWIVGVLLLFSLAGALIGLILLGWFLASRKVKRMLQIQNTSQTQSTSHVALPQREIRGGVLACSGLRAVGAFGAAAVVGGLLASLIASFTVPQDEIVSAFDTVYKAVTAPNFWSDFQVAWLGLLGEIGTMLHSQYNSDELPFFFHFVAPCFPVLLGALYAQWRAVHWQRSQNGEGEEPRFWQFVRDVLSGRFLRAGYDFDFSRAFLKLVDWLLFLICIVAWLTLAFWMEDQDSWWISVLTVALGVTAFVMLGNFIRWRRRPGRRAAVGLHLQLLRASFWGWLVLGSTLYFLLLLLSVPLRSEGEKRLDRVLRYGEVRAAQMG